MGSVGVLLEALEAIASAGPMLAEVALAAELECRLLRVSDMVLFRPERMLLRFVGSLAVVVLLPRFVDSLAVVLLFRLDERLLFGALYGLGRLFTFHWRSRSRAEFRISAPRMLCTSSTRSWPSTLATPLMPSWEHCARSSPSLERFVSHSPG
jgi:hypothetical protein